MTTCLTFCMMSSIVLVALKLAKMLISEDRLSIVWRSAVLFLRPAVSCQHSSHVLATFRRHKRCLDFLQTSECDHNKLRHVIRVPGGISAHQLAWECCSSFSSCTCLWLILIYSEIVASATLGSGIELHMQWERGEMWQLAVQLERLSGCFVWASERLETML